MLNMKLTKETGNVAGTVRMFAILGEFHTLHKNNEKALKMLEEAIYVLGFYKLNNYVKVRILADYAEVLKREERYFESSEMFQNYGRIKYGEKEINEEMLFIPDYYI